MRLSAVQYSERAFGLDVYTMVAQWNGHKAQTVGIMYTFNAQHLASMNICLYLYFCFELSRHDRAFSQLLEVGSHPPFSYLLTPVLGFITIRHPLEVLHRARTSNYLPESPLKCTHSDIFSYDSSLLKVSFPGHTPPFKFLPTTSSAHPSFQVIAVQKYTSIPLAVSPAR
jgi:hypothetical protein